MNEALARSRWDPYASAKFSIIERRIGDAPRRILNAGCGAGELSFRLTGRGHDVVSFDPDPVHISLAKDQAAAMELDPTTFSISTIEGFSGPEPFDVVIATDVLEHIEDDRTAFRALLAQTRVGGVLIVAVPAGPRLFGFHDERLGHYRRYSRSSLLALLASSPDAEPLSVRGFAVSLVPATYLFSKKLKRPYPVVDSEPSRSSLVMRRGLEAWLRLEARLPLRAGTSLLAVVRRRQSR